jgi:hypothetical protein
MATAEFTLCPDDPTNVILSFAPTNGFLNAGTATDLLLSVANCPCGPVHVGDLVVLAVVPGLWCICPSPGGIMATVDCTVTPTLWPIEWIGFEDNGGLEPCRNGLADCLKSTTVGDSRRGQVLSWGRVKGLYQ